MAEPEHLKFKHETTMQKKTKNRKQKNLSKNKRQSYEFLNRYDFAYAGRDTVNQATKVALGVIKNAGNEINKIAK